MVRVAPLGKILPDSFDILIPDIQPDDLATRVSLTLGCKYLSPAANERLSEVAGTIYGVNNRSMFTLPCHLQGANAQCPFSVYHWCAGDVSGFLGSGSLGCGAMGHEQHSLQDQRLHHAPILV